MNARRLAYVAATLIALPAAALAIVKPLRVIAPALMPGIACLAADICTDNPAALGAAQALYRTGRDHAAAAVGPFEHAPRVVFCTTQACAAAFGIDRQAAQTVGNLGAIVAPRGWKPFYLAHELIHYRQTEVLGNYTVATGPRWLIEGTTYSLSGDPRRPLTEPFESWRAQFDARHAGIGSRDLWTTAREAR